MKRYILGIIISFLIIGYPASLIAQNTDNSPRQTPRRFSFSVCLATTSSGPARDLEKAMKDAGFNDTTYGSFFSPGPIYHPFSRTGIGETGNPWMIYVHYLFKQPFGVGLVISEADIGETFGYQDSSFSFLFIKYAVRTYASVVTIQARGFRFGIGPALHYANSCQEYHGENIEKKSINRIGFLIDFGLSVPEKSRFFVEIKAQYRAVGRVEIGPYEARFLDNSAILPTSKVNYDYWFIGLGLGIRL